MIKWLETKDSNERELYQQIVEKIRNNREILDHNLAVEIINQLGKSVK